MTAIERRNARQKFVDAPQEFEAAIGAIDCTHINIIAPSEHDEAYMNHHSNHYLNVQVVCYNINNCEKQITNLFTI